MVILVVRVRAGVGSGAELLSIIQTPRIVGRSLARAVNGLIVGAGLRVLIDAESTEVTRRSRSFRLGKVNCLPEAHGGVHEP